MTRFNQFISEHKAIVYSGKKISSVLVSKIRCWSSKQGGSLCDMWSWTFGIFYIFWIFSKMQSKSWRSLDLGKSRVILSGEGPPLAISVFQVRKLRRLAARVQVPKYWYYILKCWNQWTNVWLYNVHLYWYCMFVFQWWQCLCSSSTSLCSMRNTNRAVLALFVLFGIGF